jgi:hypothetical protein
MGQYEVLNWFIKKGLESDSYHSVSEIEKDFNITNKNNPRIRRNVVKLYNWGILETENNKICFNFNCLKYRIKTEYKNGFKGL